MRIRLETPPDHVEVRAIVTAAFEQEDEATAVDALRSEPGPPGIRRFGLIGSWNPDVHAVRWYARTMPLLPQELGESLGFHSVRKGVFMARDGAARASGEAKCNKKICFTATNLPLLARLLRELSDHPKAFFVKFSTRPRDGMYLGRCFFTDEETVGETWARYKAHPEVFCNIQDDDFTIGWRSEVQSWTP